MTKQKCLKCKADLNVNNIVTLTATYEAKNNRRTVYELNDGIFLYSYQGPSTRTEKISLCMSCYMNMLWDLVPEPCSKDEII